MATGGPYYQVAFGQLSQTVFMISLSPDGNNYYETKQLLISFPLPLSLSTLRNLSTKNMHQMVR